MTIDERVPRGAYRTAAIALSYREGSFDAYDLAVEVEKAVGRWVSYRAAGAWIRRNRGWLRRVAGPIRARVADGGCPSSYAVVEVVLRREAQR